VGHPERPCAGIRERRPGPRSAAPTSRLRTTTSTSTSPEIIDALVVDVATDSGGADRISFGATVIEEILRG
jgi:hypothetical protein